MLSIMFQRWLGGFKTLMWRYNEYVDLPSKISVAQHPQEVRALIVSDLLFMVHNSNPSSNQGHTVTFCIGVALLIPTDLGWNMFCLSTTRI